MFTKQRQIDLHLPTSWNRCTTEELEAIAAAIIQEQQRVDRYHPFDWQRVKLSIVLSINEITISEERRVKSEEFATATDSDTYLVRRPQDKEPWAISTGQLLVLTDMLEWVDDEKADRLIFQFPYPTMQVDGSGKTAAYGEGGSKFFTLHSSLFTLQGPPPQLDGYTWREYRWLTDWMQEYMRHSNAKNAEGAAQAQREFLTILFKPAADATGTVAAEANSSLFTLHSSLFTDFSPVKWQVILFWWSSLMSMLAKKFPRVFKRQPVGKRRPQKADTPWDFYNCVTAMLADEYKSSEADQQNETYSVTLQKLENVAEKAAEMEKLKKK